MVTGLRGRLVLVRLEIPPSRARIVGLRLYFFWRVVYTTAVYGRRGVSNITVWGFGSSLECAEEAVEPPLSGLSVVESPHQPMGCLDQDTP